MLNSNYTKLDLIKKLSKETGFSFNLSKKLINDFIEILIINIKSGNLNLKNVGSFKIIKMNERIGRNPKTKVEYVISPRKSIKFVPSQKIKEILNRFI